MTQTKILLKTYKYRIYPNKLQKELLEKHFGCSRFIYNWGLSKKNETYDKCKKTISYYDLSKELTKLKQTECPWLYEVSHVSLQQSLLHLEAGYSNFFKHNFNKPKFKNKKGEQSFSVINNVSIDFDKQKLKIPKFTKTPLKIKIDRIFDGKIKTCTVKKTITNKYYVCMLVETVINETNLPKIKSDTTIGIDLGIKDFCTLSNGEKIENPKFLQIYLNKIKFLQKKLAKKQKNSNNYNKTNLKIALLYEKITNKRLDFLHKLSHKLIHDNQVDTICLETLNISKMLKNSNLAQKIQDSSWNKFNKILEYKACWNNKNVLRVNLYEPTSKLCSKCGYINNDLKLQDRVWICPKCNITHDRDINASLNIKKIALKNAGLGRPEEPVELLSKQNFEAGINKNRSLIP